MYNFDDIRSFRDNEVNEKLLEILDDERFKYVLKKVFPEDKVSRLKKELYSLNSVSDFQRKYISNYVKAIVDLTISELTVEGIEHLKPDVPYVFISNHRDIILDSALINKQLYLNNFNTSEIAIGSNLLIFKWIEYLTRLNKSFIVRRNLKGKEMLKETIKLSAYIRDTLVRRKTSVWIAQREGRTKDGADQTDAAILKMLSMSGSKNFTENFAELNIVPVSISYEYEPNIESKIAVTYSLKNGRKYTKTTEEDLKDMGRGLYGSKGKVCIAFGQALNNKLASIEKIQAKNEKYTELAQRIDNEIYKNYKLSKHNYIAFDILTDSKKFFRKQVYTKNEETKLRVLCKKTIKPLEGNKDLLEKIFYQIYANPLINKLL